MTTTEEVDKGTPAETNQFVFEKFAFRFLVQMCSHVLEYSFQVY